MGMSPDYKRMATLSAGERQADAIRRHFGGRRAGVAERQSATSERAHSMPAWIDALKSRVVAAEKAEAALRFIRARGQVAWIIGEIVRGMGTARVA